MSIEGLVPAYQHSLPPAYYEQLCALPEVIARYSPGANDTDVMRNLREDCAGLPEDPDQRGNRLLDLDAESQEAIVAMLRWAGDRSHDRRFVWMARDLQVGAEEADRKLLEQSSLN